MPRRRFLSALLLTHLLFLMLVQFYEHALWSVGGPSTWLLYHLARTRCGPVGAYTCFVEIGSVVRGTVLLASTLTCAMLCMLYCAISALWYPQRRVWMG